MRLRRALARPFRYQVRWLSFLAGGVPAVLVFPGPSLSYLAWFALVPGMVLFTRAATTREAIARGWWFGAGYLIAILQWMTPEIGPGVVLIGAVFGCLWSPFAVAVHRLLTPPVRTTRALTALIVVPSCWLVPEWVRSYQGLGGPWGLYGASQWQHPAVLALASVGGVWLVSVALLIANTGLTLLIGALGPAVLGSVAPPPESTKHTESTESTESTKHTESTESTRPVESTRAAERGAPPRRSAMALLGAAAFAAAALTGPLAFALTPPFPAVRQVTIALVQPGAVRDATRSVDASEALTAEFGRTGALARDHPNLIIWGESSVADDLSLDHARLRRIETLSAQDKAEILASQDATIPGPNGGGQEKVAVLVSPSGIMGRYVKTRLVPFGEYIPFRQQLGWLTKISKAAGSNMIPGTGAHLLTVTTAGSKPFGIGVLVCFESAFPDMSGVEADAGAQVIVYQSSMSTFQGTWGPDQQGSLAAVRAAEIGRPVVQAALTGDTVAFDARGRELAWLGQDSQGVVTVRLNLPAAADQTLYDGAGDYIMWTGVAITALTALVMLGRRRGFLGHTASISCGSTAEYDTDTGVPVRTK